MKNVIVVTWLLCAPFLKSQENKTTLENNALEKNHSVTIRIKKVETVNGVENTTDTTYTVNGPIKVADVGKFGNEGNSEEKEVKTRKIVVITDEVHGDSVHIVDLDEVMDEQVHRAMKLVAEDGKNVEKVMTLNVDTREPGFPEKNMTKIVILKTATIEDPNEKDAIMLSKRTGVTDGKLILDQINFYPNPSSGKFNLSFSLPDKADVEITILNTSGKKIYTEKMHDFTGNYDKEIDISQNPKGAYFVRIAQGGHAQVKKVVLE